MTLTYGIHNYYNDELIKLHFISHFLDHFVGLNVGLEFFSFRTTIVIWIFNIFKYPVLSFQFISHRLLRWTLIPLCFPVLIFSNIVLVYSGGSVLYLIMLALQCFFYAMVLCGALANSKAHMPTLIKVCHYIFFMNYNVYLGFIRFVRHGQSPIWDKVSRTNLVKVG